MANHSGPVKYYYFILAYKYMACVSGQLSPKMLFDRCPKLIQSETSMSLTDVRFLIH
jgi:hypothetical protein